MAPIQDHIIYAAILTKSAALSFVKINVLGTVSSVATGIIGLAMLYAQTANPSDRPFALVLVLVCMFAMPFVFFALGNKYIIAKVGGRLVRDNADTVILPLIDRSINGVKQKQPELLRKGADRSLLRLKMLQELKTSSGNKWTRRVVAYGLKRIDIQDSDLAEPNVGFSDVVKQKITRFLQGFGEPKRTVFFVLIGLEMLLLLMIAMRAI